MRVVALNGSPNQNGNTYQCLSVVMDELCQNGIPGEILQVGNRNVAGCIGCKRCSVTGEGKCCLPDDGTNELIQQIIDADGIIIGSPVHFSGIASTFKCFLDRAFYVCSRNRLLRHKVGAVVVAVRRSGGVATIDSLLHYLTYSEMILATSGYWTVIHGQKAGEVIRDLEGMDTLKILGQNMSWILQIRENGIHHIEPPNTPRRSLTNFIR